MNIGLAVLAVCVAIILLLGFALSKRYGRLRAAQTLAAVIIFSFIVAFVTFRILVSDMDKNINPAEDWQKIASLDKRVTELQYRPESGLFAKTDNGETKITDIIPFCLPGGKLALSHPRQIELTTEPYPKLPTQPYPFKQQISFNVAYPVEAEASATSSFIVYENGEVWCTERFDQAGQSAAVAFGFGAFIALYIAAIVFVGSFILTLLLAIIALEIYRWKQKVKLIANN